MAEDTACRPRTKHTVLLPLPENGCLFGLSVNVGLCVCVCYFLQLHHPRVRTDDDHETRRMAMSFSRCKQGGTIGMCSISIRMLSSNSNQTGLLSEH